MDRQSKVFERRISSVAVTRFEEQGLAAPFETISKRCCMYILRLISGTPYFGALAMFLGTLLAVKITDVFIDRVLLGLAGRTKIEADDLAVSIIHRPVCITVFLLGFREALGYLGPAERFITYANSLFISGIIITWTIAAVRLNGLFLDRAAGKVSDIAGISHEVIPLVKNTVRAIIIGIGILLILAEWNISITPFLASAGIAGVAVALAAKETLANFFGGVSIFTDKPYKIGDYIILDSKERGEVVEIGMRSTRIRTRDDVLVTIPNSVMAASKIVNESVPVERFRVSISIGAAYGSDAEQVEKLLLAAAEAHPLVLEDPVPRVRFRAFGESALEFELLCWIKDPARKGQVIHDLNKTIYRRFAGEGITIPFPQRVIHIHAPSHTEEG